MKTCSECGVEIPDESKFCPKCGAPQPQVQPQVQAQVPPQPQFQPQPHAYGNMNYPNAITPKQDIWESPIFAILSFAGAALFVLATFAALICTFKYGIFIFPGVVLFLCSVLNIVGALPAFIKLLNKK